MTISPINLGNTFTNSGGTTVTSGLSSGLNTSAIINSLVSTQTGQVTKMQDKITSYNSQTSALNTLNQLLTNLQNDTASLSAPQSPDSTTNVFALRTATVSGNTSQAASNFLTASASSLATAGTYTISNITQIATSTIQQTGSFNIANANTSVVAASPTAGMFSAGTFYVNGQAITLTAGETLNQVASAFNTVSSTTGMTASAIETSTGVFTLVFTGSNTGLTNAFNLNTTTTNVISVASPTTATTGQIAAGTYSVNGHNVTIAANDTLNNIANDFNSAGAGVTATVVQVGTGQYQLQFTGNVSGLSSFASSFDLMTPSTNTISVADANTATSGQIAAGTYTINGKSVTIAANDTLNNIANDFNSANAGITATVVNVGSGQFQLQFTGNTSALNPLASDFDLNTSTLVTATGDTSGVLSNITFSTAQAAQDAKFTYNGIQVDRASNTVTDLASGVTFNLLQNTNSQSGASLTVTVTPDSTNIQNVITAFVNDYNSFLTFYTEQTQLDSSTGVPLTSAVLDSDNTLNTIYNQLTNYASSIVSGLSGDSSLQDIGISFSSQEASGSTPAVQNTLSIDSTTLQNTINDNLTGLEQVLGYNATSSSPDLAVFTPPNNLTISNYTINVDQTTLPPTYTATYTDPIKGSTTVNLTAGTLSTGVSLTAPTSSGLNGLVLIYTGPSQESNMTVNSTNGIGSLMNTLLTSATKANTGLIATDQQSIATQVTATQTQITNVNNQISTTRQQLLTKFSALESAIAAANSALNYLNAQQVASLGASA